MTGKLKVYELAKELGVESQHLLEVTQRLGVQVKGVTSVLGTEEIKAVRDYFKKNKPTPAKKESSASTGSKSSVSEKRVGATVIRRRAVSKAQEAPPTVEAEPEGVQGEPSSPSMEEVLKETSASAPAPETTQEEASMLRRRQLPRFRLRRQPLSKLPSGQLNPLKDGFFPRL